ncbi:glycosyltransferase family 2 protein [Pontibacter qinzhouensis]|uniref:Glycosyltransferase family 2 protein n=1 Tax=Pontibacter qinzhouensis TaxID=2603253 RepID=A0A5C8K611_9BACT|nr:glycosyltransferase family 2 protein [Pontibacter qinzhouensis]TXK46765.1 glycosyltransferase family 2 protein [Pontibacter qinzhouensis]
MSSLNPAFSVIIPLYNKELHIAKTLDSVLVQTWSGFEVVVVDDGSTDGSLRLVQNYAATDARIKVYSKPNGGVSSARNYGIGKAQNEYIAFLDADDFWEKNYLEEMNRLIARYPDCGMYGCAYKAVKRNKTIYNCQHVPEGIIEDYFQVILKDRISWTSATIVRKDIFAKAGMFPVGMIGGEDYFMWAKVAKDYKMAFTPQVLSSYNMVFSNSLGRIGHHDSCQESWYELYRSNDFYLNEFIAKKAIENGIRHAWGSHKAKSTEIEKQFKYTQLFKRNWKKLYYLNRLPRPLVNLLLLYKKMQTYYYLNFSRNF